MQRDESGVARSKSNALHSLSCERRRGPRASKVYEERYFYWPSAVWMQRRTLTPLQECACVLVSLCLLRCQNFDSAVQRLIVTFFLCLKKKKRNKLALSFPLIGHTDKSFMPLWGVKVFFFFFFLFLNAINRIQPFEKQVCVRNEW